MKEIKLTQGYFAKVNDEDYEYLNQFKWHVNINKSYKYAKRHIYDNGKDNTMLMHHDIMKRIWIDHKDGDGLNNQRSNLRFCTQHQNNMNAKPNKNTTSIYKGVGKRKGYNRWKCIIQFNKKTIYLGDFSNEIEAAKAYDRKAKELFGEFAYLNFKNETL